MLDVIKAAQSRTPNTTMSLQWAQTELKNNVDKRERKNKDCIVFKFDVETVGVRVCVCLV